MAMTTNTTGGSFPSEEYPPLPYQTKPLEPPIITNTHNTNVQQNLYGNVVKPKPQINPTTGVPPNPVVMLHEEPNITWKSSEVKSLIVKENIQYVIVGKFSYDKLDISTLRKNILK